jgi:ribosomal protein S18 acetylase RimI-like enzyme
MKIIPYNDRLHREQVILIWQNIFCYCEARNKPAFVIDRKLAVNDNLFFVALEQQKVIGTIMAGYDGHRGWIYALAVIPEMRKKGIGTQLLKHAEDELIIRGCVKINLQIMAENREVKEFYLKNGFCIEERISMGKVIKT